jgi:hypothetical protein
MFKDLQLMKCSKRPNVTLCIDKEDTTSYFFQTGTGISLMNNFDAASRLEAMLGQTEFAVAAVQNVSPFLGHRDEPCNCQCTANCT